MRSMNEMPMYKINLGLTNLNSKLPVVKKIKVNTTKPVSLANCTHSRIQADISSSSLRTCDSNRVENHTKSNLFMDQVDFEPAQHYGATILIGDGHHSEKDSPTKETFKPPVLIRSGGGIYNYLHQLKSSLDDSTQIKVDRLLTQQILGIATTKKEIELQVVEVPSIINLQRLFTLKLNLANLTERGVGPFEVSVSQSGSPGKTAVMINGLQSMFLS